MLTSEMYIGICHILKGTLKLKNKSFWSIANNSKYDVYFEMMNILGNLKYSSKCVLKSDIYILWIWNMFSNHKNELYLYIWTIGWNWKYSLKDILKYISQADTLSEICCGIWNIYIYNIYIERERERIWNASWNLNHI